MSDVKARLQGGVQEKKRQGAERLKAILEEVRSKGVVSEAELLQSTGMDKQLLDRCIEYLRENGLIEVKKKLFKDVEITVPGGRNVHVPVKVAVKEGTAQPRAVETRPVKPQGEEPAKEPQSYEVRGATEPLKPTVQGVGQPDVQPGEPEQAAPAQSAVTPPAGAEKVVPETEEELQEVCKSLVTDFIGVMRLHGEADGEFYSTALMIDKGDIIAISFENMDLASVTVGDEAYREILERFQGTKGDLEIFEMSEDDLNQSLQSNINCLLTSPAKLSALNIKIKRIQHAEEPQKKSLLSGLTSVFSQPDTSVKADWEGELKETRRRRVEKLGGMVNLLDFARGLELDSVKAKRFEEIRKAKQAMPHGNPAAVDPRKAARLEELKAKRKLKLSLPGLGGAQAGGGYEAARPDQTSASSAQQNPDNIPVKTVQSGIRVSTGIDKLYEHVKREGKVKLNDVLASKLGINKTQIEEWAMILEEHSLLEVKYPTIGEPEISLPSGNKDGRKEAENGGKKK